MKITAAALLALVAAAFVAPHYTTEPLIHAARGTATIGPLNALKLAVITNPAAAVYTLARIGAVRATGDE